MIRHTTINLDTELLSEAQQILGTSQATETIHRTLREVIDLHKRRRLAEHDFSELTPEALEEMRRSRTFDSADAQRQS